MPVWVMIARGVETLLSDSFTLSPAALRFGDLPVDARIGGALAAMGFTDPTPIQAQAIPPLRAGHDVVGLARTGSGKTAGFGIPLIEAMRPGERQVQALVLTPTRELASQVATVLAQLGKSSGVRVVAVYGGVGMEPQITAMRGNAHVVVGTPGRVFDHLGRGTLDLRHTHFVILDEADRMLDVGFAPAIDAILSRIPGPRQTSLFSATFPKEVEAMVGKHTRDAVRIAVDVPGAALESLEERFVPVPSDHDKVAALTDVLNLPDCKLALVFRRTTHRADKLSRLLERDGVRVATLHGRRTQAQREKALGALRSGQVQALVATDIAARGLDISGLTHVVNFDLPDTAENYTHRVGRTARMGAVGVAITFIAPEDEEALRALQRKLAPSATRQAATARQGQRPTSGRPSQVSPARHSSFRGQRPSNEGAAPAARTPRPTHEQAAHPAPVGGSEHGSAVEQRPAAARPASRRSSGGAQSSRRLDQRSAPAGQQVTGSDEAWYPFRSRQSEPSRSTPARDESRRTTVPSWYPAASRRG